MPICRQREKERKEEKEEEESAAVVLYAGVRDCSLFCIMTGAERRRENLRGPLGSDKRRAGEAETKGSSESKST